MENKYSKKMRLNDNHLSVFMISLCKPRTVTKTEESFPSFFQNNGKKAESAISSS